MSIVRFEDIDLNIVENSQHEFLLSNKEVALGYGVLESNIREHKSNNKDELIENKHFIIDYSYKNTPKTLWTKRGIVRLGFFIKSERAKKFRDFAEDLILSGKTYNQTKHDINEPLHLILYDKRLSAQSKNIYFLLFSNSRHWIINNTEVMEILDIKQRQTIANYWKELLETGWIDRYRDKNSFVYRLNKEPKEIPGELKKHQKRIEIINKLETLPQAEYRPLRSSSPKNFDLEQITPKMVEIAKNKGFTEQEATEMFEHFTD